MSEHIYSDKILPTIREILTEDHNAELSGESIPLSPEEADESFSNRRLLMVREVDPQTFKKWTERAFARLCDATQSV